MNLLIEPEINLNIPKTIKATVDGTGLRVGVKTNRVWKINFKQNTTVRAMKIIKWLKNFDVELQNEAYSEAGILKKVRIIITLLGLWRSWVLMHDIRVFWLLWIILILIEILNYKKNMEINETTEKDAEFAWELPIY